MAILHYVKELARKIQSWCGLEYMPIANKSEIEINETKDIFADFIAAELEGLSDLELVKKVYALLNKKELKDGGINSFDYQVCMAGLQKIEAGPGIDNVINRLESLQEYDAESLLQARQLKYFMEQNAGQMFVPD